MFRTALPEPMCRVTQAPMAGSMPAWAPLLIPGRVKTPEPSLVAIREDVRPRAVPRRAGLGYSTSTGSMPGKVLMWAQETVTWPVAHPR
jgi:hypothetical protein